MKLHAAVCLLALLTGCERHVPSPAPERSALPRPSSAAQDLIEAAKQGRVDDVRRLLDSGLDPNARSPHEELALITAAFEGQAEVVDALLEHGADPDLRDANGQTALFVAAYERNVEIVEMLLAAGADADIATQAGETALLRSVFWGDQLTVSLLLDAGANPDTVSDGVLNGIGFKSRSEWEQRVRDVQGAG